MAAKGGFEGKAHSDSARAAEKGKRKTISPQAGASLCFLYENLLGRLILKGLVHPSVSRLCGRFMESRLSRRLIKGFIQKNGINMQTYEKREYTSFNDFFCRRLSCFSFDRAPDRLIAPCDAKLSAFPITQEREFFIKGIPYRIEELLQNRELDRIYEGGYCLIFRLAVDDYHRYCYVDDGRKGQNIFIPGKLHTVQPIALRRVNIYRENCREYTVMETEHFGTVTQVEVGALLVGKILNHHQETDFKRGQEKGMFCYGGSTIVLLLEKGRAELDMEILDNTKASLETIVKIGEPIGRAI